MKLNQSALALIEQGRQQLRLSACSAANRARCSVKASFVSCFVSRRVPSLARSSSRSPVSTCRSSAKRSFGAQTAQCVFERVDCFTECTFALPTGSQLIARLNQPLLQLANPLVQFGHLAQGVFTLLLYVSGMDLGSRLE